MVMHRSFEDLKKAIEEMNKNDAVPIFLFLCKK